jgi:hypothetical protein
LADYEKILTAMALIA